MKCKNRHCREELDPDQDPDEEPLCEGCQVEAEAEREMLEDYCLGQDEDS